MSDADRAPYIAEAEKLRILHQMEYPDYKYRPKKRQKSGGQVSSVSSSQVTHGHSPTCVKLESDTDDSADTPVKRFKTEHNTLMLEPPESPSYSFPLAPDYLSPDLTPPSKVPSSPVMVSLVFLSFNHFYIF